MTTEKESVSERSRIGMEFREIVLEVAREFGVSSLYTKHDWAQLPQEHKCFYAKVAETIAKAKFQK